MEEGTVEKGFTGLSNPDHLRLTLWDRWVMRQVVVQLLAMLDRGFGNLVTVKARKMRVDASRSDVGRVLKPLCEMGLLESSRRWRSRNAKSYLAHKSIRMELLKLLVELEPDLNRSR
jgi:methylphosphotriester-DNA--protein-cysteine methyltransferase